MKKVLITGGANGIGRACVEIFANQGYSVAFIYVNDNESAASLEKSCNARGICADISVPEKAKQAYISAIEYLGGIDVLINNAGISHIGLFTDISYDEWRRVLDVNLTGAFLMSKMAAADMIKQHSGSIVNIGSVWGREGASCEVAYSASKAGIRGLTTSLAKELGPSGIRVNCVEPGVINTRMNNCFDEETIKQLEDETPLCRIGNPSEVANAVFFLAGDKASYITGQILGVDGGFPS